MPSRRVGAWVLTGWLPARREGFPGVIGHGCQDQAGPGGVGFDVVTSIRQHRPYPGSGSHHSGGRIRLELPLPEKKTPPVQGTGGAGVVMIRRDQKR